MPDKMKQMITYIHGALEKSKIKDRNFQESSKEIAGKQGSSGSTTRKEWSGDSEAQGWEWPSGTEG